MSAEISVYEKQLIHEIEETPQEYIPKLPIIVWSTRTPPHILCAHQARDHKREPTDAPQFIAWVAWLGLRRLI